MRTIAAMGTSVSSPVAVPAARDYYIDRLRTVMTSLVILHHVAITYGASGGWFWYEDHPSAAPASILLTLFCATNQAYFMGFFFLLAGYFTPRSLERKGSRLFLWDRFLRLGIPLLAFILILGPVTVGIVTLAEDHSFWLGPIFLWQHKRIVNGPLWFAQALLMFSIGYCAWRAVTARSAAQQHDPKLIPSARWWLLGALGVAAVSILVRQIIPVGENVFGLQLGYFPGYIFLFCVGIAAWRHDWLRKLTWQTARAWIITSAIAWPMMPIAIFFARTSGPGKSNFSGGLSWPAILYAVWEPFVAWGLICLWLLVFRSRQNQPSPLWDWLNRRAYAVYIIHPVILVAVAILLHPWAAPALLKFGVTGSITISLCWLVSDPLVRIPGLRSIL